MKELFREVFQSKGVKGALLLDSRGRILNKALLADDPGNPADTPWWPDFVGGLNGAGDFELVCEGGRVYIRRASGGYLVIWTDETAPMAMIRLSCDLLVHSLKSAAGKRWKKGFFRRRG